MTDIDSDLQEKVIRLEKENENLQKDLENDIKTQSDLIEKKFRVRIKSTRVRKEKFAITKR